MHLTRELARAERLKSEVSLVRLHPGDLKAINTEGALNGARTEAGAHIGDAAPDRFFCRRTQAP